jgi:hypothetical protein
MDTRGIGDLGPDGLQRANGQGGRLDRVGGRALGLLRELERLRVKEQQRPSARVKGAKMNFRMLGHEEELGCL